MRESEASTIVKLFNAGIAAICICLLGGCASMQRPNYEAAAITASASDAMGGIRFRPDMPPAIANRQDASRDILALSGGGPDGAYGVGLLRGWQERGDMPRFDVVTRVSTGALMSPFAFLGGDALARLESLYTGADVGRILAQGSPVRLLRGPSIYRQRNLRRLLAENVTSQMLADIAIQHRNGRRLYIATGNLDAQVMQIWDMGEIAARATPESETLFREIMLAAASVPLAFDPVMLPSSTGNSAVIEAHADATLFSLFYFDGSMFDEVQCRSVAASCNLYVVAHNKTLPEPKTVKLSASGVGGRALETIIKADLLSKLIQAQTDAHRAGATFNLAFLDVPYSGVSAIDFDVTYMRNIFAFGRTRGLAGGQWLTEAPQDSTRRHNVGNETGVAPI
jgi:predicted acylesterase/phospholipase RssA